MTPDRLVTVRVRIFGQALDLRVEPGAEEQVQRVAAVVDGRMRERRGQGANSDLRAAIMSAFEFAHELDEHHVDLAKFRTISDRTLGSTRARIDRLLANLDREVGARERPESRPPTLSVAVHEAELSAEDSEEVSAARPAASSPGAAAGGRIETAPGSADNPAAGQPAAGRPNNPAREARNAALAALRNSSRTQHPDAATPRQNPPSGTASDPRTAIRRTVSDAIRQVAPAISQAPAASGPSPASAASPQASAPESPALRRPVPPTDPS